MKRLIVLIIAMAVVLGALIGCSNDKASTSTSDSNSDYNKLSLKLNVAGTEQGIDTTAARKFAELVEEGSDGNITIEIYTDSQLAGGDQSKSIELLLSGGSYELAALSGSVLVNIDEKFLTHMLPFVFESYDDVSYYLDGTGGEYYSQLMAENNIISMGSFHNGLRQLTNNTKEIRTPDDLKNMKMRVPGGEVFVKTFQDLGADPISMGWGEVYTALQQKTIDGHENSYQQIESAGIQEVQDYITEINWGYNAYWFMASSKVWEGFNEATQDLIMEKSIEAAEYARKLTEENEKKIKQDFIEDGIIVTELTQQERQLFIDATKKTREYFINKFGDEPVKAWGIGE